MIFNYFKCMKGFVIGFCFLFSFIGFAQNPDEILLNNKTKYPDESVVVLDYHVTYDIELNKHGEVEIVLTTEEKRLVISDRSVFEYSDKVYSSSFKELEEIEAYSLINENNRYKKREAAVSKEKDNLGNSIFSDDLKVNHISYSGLNEGAQIVIKTKHRISDPFFLRSFRLYLGVPINNVTFSVKVDERIDLGLKYFNFEQEVKPTIKNKGRSTIYEWQFNDIEDLDFESDMPSAQNYISEISVYIKKYTFKGETKDVLTDLSSLHAWYNSFLGKMNIENNDELNAIVDSLIQPYSTKRDQAEQIFFWVQDHIKYVAFEAGYQGFQPRNPQDVFQKLYGDCKDNTSILVYMFNRADIPAYFTWIGTRDIPFSYLEKHTPDIDNHMICTIKLDGKYLFLDGTARSNPLELPTGFIQGKEALIHISENEYIIKEVPVTASNQNVHSDSVSVSLENGELVGHGKTEFSGYVKTNTYYHLNSLNGDDLKERVYSFVTKGSNKFKMNDYALKGLDSKTENISIQYDFSLLDYVTELEDEIYVNLNLKKSWTKSKLKEDRKYPYENDHPYKYINVYDLEIPEGYEVKKLPSNLEIEHKEFEYSLTYTLEHNKIRLSIIGDGKELVLPVEQFENWNDAVKKIQLKSKEVIVLKKK